MMKLYECCILGVDHSRRDVCAVEEDGCDGLRGYCADEIDVAKCIYEGIM